jgi:hypothetical protein
MKCLWFTQKTWGDTAVTSPARDSWIPDSTIAADQLTERQRHERDYHREYAAKHAHLVKQPVVKDVLRKEPRRPWNAFWSMYDRILAADISGKHVLLPGCGRRRHTAQLSQRQGISFRYFTRDC